MKKGLKIVGGIVLGLGILSFGGCAVMLWGANEAVESVDESIKEMEQEQVNQDKLLQEMLDAATPEVEKSMVAGLVVTYTLTNNTGVDFDYVQLNYDFFDKDGVKIESSFVNTTNVKDGQTFKLEFQSFDETARDYEVSITSNPLE